MRKKKKPATKVICFRVPKKRAKLIHAALTNIIKSYTNLW